MTVEKAGWEAWKARDAKALGDVTTANISFVDAMGAYTATKDETIKFWTQGKCDIKSVNVTDGESIVLSDTVAILTFKGTAVGTCDGQKLGPLWGATVFQNDGGTWKAAFIFEKPAS